MSDSFDRLLAESQRRPVSAHAACPEPGVLAAYLDGALAPTERSALEAHVADCARCTLQLAAVVRLEDATGHPASAPRPWWRRAWVIPAAAAAVVTAVYIAVPTTVPPPEATPESAAMPSEPTGAVAAQREEAPPLPSQSLAPGGAALDEPVLARPLPARTGPSLAARAPDAPSAAAADPALASAAKAEAPAAGAETRQLPTVVAAPQDAERKVSGAAAMESPGLARGASVSLRVPELGSAVFLVESPDASVRWRVAGSRIERSADGGRTWSLERAPAISGVTMGAAPSAEVCWLATSAGRVLRRSEGGEWRDVSPQPPAAIMHVRDATPRAVSLVGRDGGVTTTADGGQTWTRHAPR